MTGMTRYRTLLARLAAALTVGALIVFGSGPVSAADGTGTDVGSVAFDPRLAVLAAVFVPFVSAVLLRSGAGGKTRQYVTVAVAVVFTGVYFAATNWPGGVDRALGAVVLVITVAQAAYQKANDFVANGSDDPDDGLNGRTGPGILG